MLIYETNMKTNKKHLTESQLRNVIAKTIKNALSEGYYGDWESGKKQNTPRRRTVLGIDDFENYEDYLEYNRLLRSKGQETEHNWPSYSDWNCCESKNVVNENDFVDDKIISEAVRKTLNKYRR